MQTGTTFMDYLLGISAFIITGLLSWVGYYLREFATTVKDLKTAVEQLRLVLSVEQEKTNNMKDMLTNSVNSLDNKVTSIENKVESHEKDIVILKTIHSDKIKIRS